MGLQDHTKQILAIGVWTAMAYGALLIAFLAYCLFCATHPTRHESKSLPGAFYSTEGSSKQSALFSEAAALMERKDFFGAKRVYQRIIEAEPLNPPGYIGMGSCQYSLNDLDGAERNYRRAVELDSRTIDGHIGLACVAYARWQYAAAVDLYEKALAMNPNLPDAHYGAGVSYLALRDYPEALEHLNRFTELAPDSNLIRTVRAMTARIQRMSGPQTAR